MRSSIRWPHIAHPTPCKGMVWRSNSDSLLYNMRDLRGAIIITTTNPWPEREGGAPDHLVRATTPGKPVMPVFFASLSRLRSRGRRTDGSLTVAT